MTNYKSEVSSRPGLEPGALCVPNRLAGSDNLGSRLRIAENRVESKAMSTVSSLNKTVP